MDKKQNPSQLLFKTGGQAMSHVKNSAEKREYLPPHKPTLAEVTQGER